MLRMTFEPSEPLDTRQMLAAFAYQAIWQKDGDRIQETFYKLTALKFRQRKIRAKIIPGEGSKAGLAGTDMTLAAEEYTEDQKRRVLVHELAHRLLGGNRIWTGKNRAWHYHAHFRIDLFLYDAWVLLYGRRFADKALKEELGFGRFYTKAWNRAMNKTRQERRESLAHIVARTQRIYGHESLW